MGATCSNVRLRKYVVGYQEGLEDFKRLKALITNGIEACEMDAQIESNDGQFVCCDELYLLKYKYKHADVNQVEITLYVVRPKNPLGHDNGETKLNQISRVYINENGSAFENKTDVDQALWTLYNNPKNEYLPARWLINSITNNLFNVV